VNLSDSALKTAHLTLLVHADLDYGNLLFIMLSQNTLFPL